MDAVLQGTALPVDGVGEATQLYLDQCRAVEEVLSPIAQPLLVNDYLDKVKCPQECTTSRLSVVPPVM
eukprot:11999548-Ditylum_brightwellii.AAC.1